MTWQGLTVTVVALVIGLPLGFALGRWGWQIYARSIGVVPEPGIDGTALLTVVTGAVVVTVVVAMWPAHAAAPIPRGGLADRVAARTTDGGKQTSRTPSPYEHSREGNDGPHPGHVGGVPGRRLTVRVGCARLAARGHQIDRSCPRGSTTGRPDEPVTLHPLGVEFSPRELFGVHRERLGAVRHAPLGAARATRWMVRTGLLDHIDAIYDSLAPVAEHADLVLTHHVLVPACGPRNCTTSRG